MVHAANPSLLELNTNEALTDIKKWTNINKLTVNPSKSSLLIIPP